MTCHGYPPISPPDQQGEVAMIFARSVLEALRVEQRVNRPSKGNNTHSHIMDPCALSPMMDEHTVVQVRVFATGLIHAIKGTGAENLPAGRFASG